MRCSAGTADGRLQAATLCVFARVCCDLLKELRLCWYFAVPGRVSPAGGATKEEAMKKMEENIADNCKSNCKKIEILSAYRETDHFINPFRRFRRGN